jgi:hypothetical protein
MFEKPMYSAVYTIKTIEKKGQKGEFFAPVIAFKDWVRSEELFNFAKSRFDAIKGHTIKTDETESENDAAEENIPF